MNRFVHTAVRLNTDLGRATRFFTQPDQLIRWLCSGVEVSEDKKAFSLTGIDESEGAWLWRFEAIEREKNIVCVCSDYLGEAPDRWFPVEIKLMKCTSRTEYCSEIHILQQGFEDTEAEDQLRDRYLAFWRAKLEALRFAVNGKWIIEDKDLTLDVFK